MDRMEENKINPIHDDRWKERNSMHLKEFL